MIWIDFYEYGHFGFAQKKCASSSGYGHAQGADTAGKVQKGVGAKKSVRMVRLQVYQ